MVPLQQNIRFHIPFMQTSWPQSQVEPLCVLTLCGHKVSIVPHHLSHEELGAEDVKGGMVLTEQIHLVVLGEHKGWQLGVKQHTFIQLKKNIVLNPKNLHLCQWHQISELGLMALHHLAYGLHIRAELTVCRPGTVSAPYSVTIMGLLNLLYQFCRSSLSW